MRGWGWGRGNRKLYCMIQGAALGYDDDDDDG